MLTPSTRAPRPLPAAVLARLPLLRPRTRVLILQHPSETGHALNTARLVQTGVAHARLLIGEIFQPDQWRLPGHRNLLLFPEMHTDGAPAGSASAEEEAADAPLQLIVPDGTWRKARKLLHQNPALAALPRLALHPAGPSNYRLRKEPSAGSLATVEAVVLALNQLEAPARFDALLGAFETLVDLQIAAMPAGIYAQHYGRTGRARRREDPATQQTEIN
jgi:DTW domain-containing protein YfiP